jgi:HSP20 family molecular chaperone IbpA
MRSARAVKQQTEPLATPIYPVDPDTIRWIAQKTELEIARRAFELFEARGGEHGHDWEDWFRAESEVVRPVSIAVSENEAQISVRVNVLGFDGNELKVSVEPRRLTIFGKKKLGAIETEGGKIEHIAWYPDQILRTVDLPSAVDPRRAVILLCTGVLSCDLPKVLAAVGPQFA